MSTYACYGCNKFLPEGEQMLMPERLSQRGSGVYVCAECYLTGRAGFFEALADQHRLDATKAEIAEVERHLKAAQARLSEQQKRIADRALQQRARDY